MQADAWVSPWFQPLNFPGSERCSEEDGPSAASAGCQLSAGAELAASGVWTGSLGETWWVSHGLKTTGKVGKAIGKPQENYGFSWDFNRIWYGCVWCIGVYDRYMMYSIHTQQPPTTTRVTRDAEDSKIVAGCCWWEGALPKLFHWYFRVG